MLKQERAFKFKQHSVLAHAKQRHDEINLLFVGRRSRGLPLPPKAFSDSRTSATASCTFVLASGDLTQLVNLSASSASSGTSTVISPLAESIRALPASAATCTWATVASISAGDTVHGFGLRAQRQRALRNGNDDPFRLGSGEAVAFQRLAQFGQNFRDGI